tara:strand:+ start:11371 stop:13707 length:2337 start_codon:yes stop_codon:yes gene_type:complete
MLLCIKTIFIRKLTINLTKYNLIMLFLKPIILYKNYYLIFLFTLFFFNFAHSNEHKNLEIKIIGNKNLDKEFIQSIVDTNLDINKKEYTNYVIKEIFATGYFQDVTAEISNNIMTITLKENQIINSIQFKGNNRFNNSDLEKVIEDNLTGIYVYNKSNVDKINSLLTQYYKVYGYNLVKISQYTNDINSSELDLIFEINEGEITKIKKINIIGNDSFSNRKIKSIIRSTESKFYKIISGRSKYNDNLLFIDENQIENYYQNRGFKNVEVTGSVGEFIKETNKVILNYYIKEGKKFEIDQINIIYEDSIKNQDESINDYLFESILIKKGSLYKKDKIIKSSDIIYDYLQSQGLVFIQVNPIESEIDNLVNLDFYVTPIKENYVSEIDIKGNVRTKDRVIRRELELNEGDPFIPSKIRKSRNNIQNLNFFSKINMNTQEKDGKVKVDVDVEEKSTGEFNVGLVYDSYDGTAFISGLKERNIFGDGRNVEISFNTSDDNAGINFEVVEPYVFNKKFNLLYNVNFKENDFTSSSGYKVDQQMAGFGTRYKLTDDITHFAKFDYSINNYKSIKSSASDAIKKLEGENVEFTVSNRLSYSTLDTKFRPSEGFYIDWFNKVAIDNFVLNKFSYDKFINIDKRILSVRSEIGNILSLSSSDVIDSNKFSIGGRNLRGFNKRGAGPRNSASGYIGGKNKIQAQFDYVIPISEASDNIIDFVSFVDVGKVFSNDSTPTHSTESIRASTGVGINLNTAIGPFSFTYAIPIQSESYDKEKNFVISIGWVN